MQKLDNSNGYPLKLSTCKYMYFDLMKNKVLIRIQGSYLDQGFRGIRFSMPLFSFLLIVLMAHLECSPHLAKFKI